MDKRRLIINWCSRNLWYNFKAKLKINKINPKLKKKKRQKKKKEGMEQIILYPLIQAEFFFFFRIPLYFYEHERVT